MDEPEKKAAKPVAPLDAKQIANVVGLMTRFLSRLAEVEQIKSEDLGLVEWISLRQVVEADAAGLKQRQLSSTLGVSRQRAAQITKSLKSSGLISTGATEGTKGNVLTLTDSGKAKAARIEAAMAVVIGAKFQGKAPKAFDQVAKRLPHMLHGLKAPKKAKTPKAAAEAA